MFRASVAFQSHRAARGCCATPWPALSSWGTQHWGLIWEDPSPLLGHCPSMVQPEQQQMGSNFICCSTRIAAIPWVESIKVRKRSYWTLMEPKTLFFFFPGLNIWGQIHFSSWLCLFRLVYFSVKLTPWWFLLLTLQLRLFSSVFSEAASHKERCLSWKKCQRKKFGAKSEIGNIGEGASDCFF